MATFTTRVELHEKSSTQKPGSEDYNKLHKAMEDRKFTRWTMVNGSKKPLPNAEYSLTEDITRFDVFKRAKAAVKEIQWPATILVTESNGRVLDRVD